MSNRAIQEIRSSRKTTRLWPQLYIGAIGIAMVWTGLPAYASESQTPWECSNYTGDAHTRCVETFADSQRDQIAALQEKLHTQQETVKRLQGLLDRQASANSDLQRQLSRPPAVLHSVPSLYPYPSVGFGFSLGHSRIYRPSIFYPPYIYGSRFYGPGYWGHRW